MKNSKRLMEPFPHVYTIPKYRVFGSNDLERINSAGSLSSNLNNAFSEVCKETVGNKITQKSLLNSDEEMNPNRRWWK